jgi:hypothetical protein
MLVCNPPAAEGLVVDAGAPGGAGEGFGGRVGSGDVHGGSGPSHGLFAGPGSCPLAGCLGEAGVSLLSDDELAASLRSLSEHIEELSSLRLELVAAYERREAHRRDGSATMGAWLTEGLSISARQANTMARLAARLEELPVLRQAHRAGRLSLDKVRVLAGVATAGNEAELAALGAGISHAACEELARGLRKVTAAEAGERRAKTFLRAFFGQDDGMLHISGLLADHDGATLLNALTDIADKEGPDPLTGAYAPYEERLARALAELASTRLSRHAEGHRSDVVVHVEADGSGYLAGGPGLCPETLERLLCDCRFQIVKENADGEPIGMGRKSRTATPFQNRQLKRRDGGCRFPGCGRTRLTNAHHIDHWSAGGPTDISNMAVLCVFHHHLVHEGGWQMAGDPAGELTFTSPERKVLRSPPRRPSSGLLSRLGTRGGSDPGGSDAPLHDSPAAPDWPAAASRPCEPAPNPADLCGQPEPSDKAAPDTGGIKPICDGMLSGRPVFSQLCILNAEAQQAVGNVRESPRHDASRRAGEERFDDRDVSSTSGSSGRSQTAEQSLGIKGPDC